MNCRDLAAAVVDNSQFTSTYGAGGTVASGLRSARYQDLYNREVAAILATLRTTCAQALDEGRSTTASERRRAIDTCLQAALVALTELRRTGLSSSGVASSRAEQQDCNSIMGMLTSLRNAANVLGRGV